MSTDFYSVLVNYLGYLLRSAIQMYSKCSTGSFESPFELCKWQHKEIMTSKALLNQSTELIDEFHTPAVPFICQILCSVPWCLSVYLSVCLSQGRREVSLNLGCIIIDIHCKW